MATTKKKAVAPEEHTATTPEPARTAPIKPRNIAAYEAAVEQFATATGFFVKGQFAEAQPHFEAVALAAAADEPILSDRARTYVAIRTSGRFARSINASMNVCGVTPRVARI